MAFRHWIIIAIGTVFGASFGFNEVLLTKTDPLKISALRVGLGALGCWAWAILSSRRMRLPPGMFAGLFTLGAFQFALPFAVLPFAQPKPRSRLRSQALPMP